jgi:hypothetical protein
VLFWALVVGKEKFWLMPVFVVASFFGAVVVLSKGPAIAPLIYTLPFASLH